jgi:hypothetical protein
MCVCVCVCVCVCERERESEIDKESVVISEQMVILTQRHKFSAHISKI